MTDDDLRTELTRLDEVVASIVTNARPSLMGVRAAIASVRELSTISLTLTHEIIDRVLRLERHP